MSDLEDMDSERLNELESILYASIHYNDVSGVQHQGVDVYDDNQINMERDSQSMPPPPQQREQPQQQQSKQQQRIVSNTRIINNAAAKPRYWTEIFKEPAKVNDVWKLKTKIAAESATIAEPNSNTESTVNFATKTNRLDGNRTEEPPPLPKALNTVQQLQKHQQQARPPKIHQQQQQHKKQPGVQPLPKSPQASKFKDDDEPERFDQRLLVAIPPHWPIKKRDAPGPFAKSSRKLEQHQRLAEKRQKSKRAQANRKLRQSKNQSMELISLVESDTSSDADDVVIVPLPPVPIIDVDASDEEQPSSEQPYLEENAMDAADVSLSGDRATEPVTSWSQLNSPCSSVLSSDDFIVQKDTSRFLAERARATDEDLLVLTENAIRDAAEPVNPNDKTQTVDTSSEYEFVPPSRLEEIQKNYRVDEQQFRALDVYESESDLTESGVYCKTKHKAVPTIVRNVDSQSDSSDVEEVLEPSVVKTKRLRKRRASSTNQSQSDPNNDCDKDDNDTESDDGGVQTTEVPGIARGMAVERCKRKIRKISQRRNSESVVPAMKGPIKDASSESGTEESLPTARQIAERLLQQKELEKNNIASEQQQKLPQPCERDEAMDSVGSDANNVEIADMNIMMDEANATIQTKADKKRLEGRLQGSQQSVVSTTEQEVMANKELEEKLNETSAETNPNETAETESKVEEIEHGQAEVREPIRGSDLVGWNDEMCRFYNDSWNGESFNLQKILKSMSNQRNDWRIISADRNPPARKRSHMKCTNCFEMGHLRSKCPRPRKPVICYTCGMTGHAEPRCPNAICLGCGSKQSMYVQSCNKCSFHSRIVCQLCKMRGHSIELCPDKWRRYHSTITSNVPLETHVQYRPKHCSNCSMRGHLFEECRQRIGEFRHVNFTTRIISHQKIYKDRRDVLNCLPSTESFFALDTPFHFEWSSEFSKNSCYARFLKAVGLAKPAEKRKKSAALQQLRNTTNSQIRTVRSERSATTSSDKAEKPGTVSGNKDEKVSEFVRASGQIQQKEISSNYQNNPTTSSNNQSPPASSVLPHDLDSDSNYSFSEHFELPSSTTTSNEQAQDEKKSPMDNLPDIILLNSSENDKDADKNDKMTSSENNQGISMCVNSKSLSSSTTTQPESLPDEPSEAKIIMAREQTEYLFSPEGRQFLTDSAKQCNVSVRMDFKDYGYVLVIYGLKKNQEDLQLMLLRRNQDLKRKNIDFQSQKPPKRIDVLIRFMRDGISSLAGDLGNATNHYYRIKELEQMNTKSGFKLAERKRRLLNMILFGQAGLSNGSMHLDQLLNILKRLLDEHAGDENATPALRNEIEEHWRVIFSPYPHRNYEALLQSYGKLVVKNRMTTMNIEPSLLGQQFFSKKRERPASPPSLASHEMNKNSSPTKRSMLSAKCTDQHQQKQLPPPPPIWKQDERAQVASDAQHNNNNPRSPKPRTQSHAKAPGQQRRQLPPPPPIWQHEEQLSTYNINNNHNININSNNNKQRTPKQRAVPFARLPGPMNHHYHHQQQQTQQHLLPCNNMQQRAPTLNLQLQRNRPLQSECVRLLANMERGDSRINTDASKPSIFWSRESLKYIDDIFKKTSNVQTLERLQRVLERSRRGELSHNDYRAVIRLHSLMEPH